MNSKHNFILAGTSILITFFACAPSTVFAGGNSGNKDSVVFNFKAQTQTWEVPKGVSEIIVEAYGAQGGSSNGGKGGGVRSDMKVVPGSKLTINIGGQPSGAEGGYNGGGKGCGKGFGGGGATDIRIGGTDLNARALVAGGGGGVGYSGTGGAGGSLQAGDGKYSDKQEDSAHIAKGGAQGAGGKGARAYFSKAGEIGTGGEGINNHGDCSNGAMAGGGGGYYGGGASGAGGGGGGSSYANTSNTNVVHTQGVNEGNGKLVIYWDKEKKPY